MAIIQCLRMDAKGIYGCTVVTDLLSSREPDWISQPDYIIVELPVTCMSRDSSKVGLGSKICPN